MENVFDKYNVSQVINASGKMTILGGSRVEKAICEHMELGASQFFEIKDLLDQCGSYLAQLMDVEATYIVNSASGAIAQSVASCVTRGEFKYILNLSDNANVKREIVICKGHNVDYGTPIEVTIGLGGGKVVEAGYANRCTIDHVRAKINENTAALIYVKSHHCVQKGMPDMQEFINLGHECGLPVIVDAAAEEDLLKYYHYGADVVIYSGTKAIAGPTSGFMVGRKTFIEQVKLQSQGIGRVMKVGKESILGLTFAIEKYLKSEHLSLDEQVKRLESFHNNINSIEGLSARAVQDGAGRLIMRSEITFENVSAIEVAKRLKTGKIKIYTRDYRANEGKIEIDIRDVNNQELEMIYQRIKEIVRGMENE